MFDRREKETYVPIFLLFFRSYLCLTIKQKSISTMVDKETNNNMCKTNSLCLLGVLNVGEKEGP